MPSHCDVLEADFIAPAGGNRDVLFTLFYMSLLFILFPQASLWSCIPARCSCLRWRPCTTASWQTVPPPSTSKSRSSKTSRRTFRRRTRGCRKRTENVSEAVVSVHILSQHTGRVGGTINNALWLIACKSLCNTWSCVDLQGRNCPNRRIWRRWATSLQGWAAPSCSFI